MHGACCSKNLIIARNASDSLTKPHFPMATLIISRSFGVSVNVFLMTVCVMALVWSLKT